MRKLILELYGIFRIFLGVWQIVGLLAGYLFLEWVVKYPVDTYSYVVDRDVLVLTYLAVVFRGIFHILSGVAIARLQEWGRAILFWSWPVMLLITFGMTMTIFHDRFEQGYAQQILDVIHWPKLFFYLGWIYFDLWWVTENLRTFNESSSILGVQEERMGPGQLFIFAFIAVFSISLLMFLGRPLKQGFYKGFYKASGETVKLDEPVAALEEQKQVVPTPPEPSKPIIVEEKVEQTEEVVDAMFKKTQAQEVLRDVSAPKIQDVHGSDVAVAGDIESGLSYQKMMGYIGGFCVMLAFFMQLMDIFQRKSSDHILSGVWVLLFAGFLCLMIYGFSLHLTPLVVMSLGSLVLCGGIVFLKNKYG